MDVPFTVIIVNSATKNNVTYYLLQVQQDEEEEMSYAVDRRFTEFVELEEQLRNIYGSHVLDQLPQLPKKTFMRQNSDAFVKKRHYRLQQFINGIHQIPFLIQSKTYRSFLKLNSFFPSSIPIRPFLKFVQNKSQHGIRLSNFNMIMLSHNVFISIAGCHPEIAFCSAEKIQSIQNRINQSNQAYSNKNKHKSSKSSKSKSNSKYLSSEEQLTIHSLHSSSPLMNNGHHHAMHHASPLMQQPGSPLSGRMANDLTNSPSSQMLPSPNEWGGCIQIWYYDTTAMNSSSGNFSWWLEERGDDNKNFYGWNSSTNTDNKSMRNPKKSLYDEYNNERTMDYYSYYGGADDLPIAQHELQTNKESGLQSTKISKNLKRKRMKEVHRELDCIFLNEVPTSLYYDREYQQLFVGTLMGNIHRFKIIHNAKIEATGILPNPNIYNNVSNIHSYCHSSIYTYIHHQQFANNQSKIVNKQRIHQRLYEQRELLKLKERQLHHKKAKRKMALIPDNDAIYNKAVLNMVSFDGVLYVSDACCNIHAFDINEFKHLHYLSLDHYFVDILQTEYKVHVDEYYKKRLSQYRAQHQRMMFKSNEPKDIHATPPPDFGGRDDDAIGAGGLFSKTFLKNRGKKSGLLDDDDLETQKELQSYGLQKEHENTLSVSMRIGGVEADTAYEMYFDELVFSTTITKQKEKILNVTNKLNQDIIVTDLIKFEDSLFIPTNLPYMTLKHLRYPNNFNVIPPKISISAVETQNNIEDEKLNNENKQEYANPYKGQRYKQQIHNKSPDDWNIISKQNTTAGCDNIFGTVSNFDSNNDVLYSIPAIHSIHKDFLIYDYERIRASAHRLDNDNTHDMSVYNQCTIFVWAFTTHISLDANINNNNNEQQNEDETQFKDYDSWYDNKQKLNKKKIMDKKRKKKGVNLAVKDRTWYLKAKWFDKTVDYICKEFSALTYCPSVHTLAVAGVSGYIALFNAVGICFNIFFAHTDCISKMIWLDGHKQLVSTGLDGTIKIWDLYHSQYTINVNPNPNEVLNEKDSHNDPKDTTMAMATSTSTSNMNNTQSAQANVQYLNTKKSRPTPPKDTQIYKAEEKEKERDELPDLGITNDEDLADLWKSKTDNINVDDYDPFGDKAFDDYLDKREKNFAEQSQNFYKPIKPQRKIVSSKELFATQTVLKDNMATKHNTPPAPIKSKAAKSGFRTMKVKSTQKLIGTQSPQTTMDEMADIESYILQQHNEQQRSASPPEANDILATNNLNSSVGIGSDHSPNPAIMGLDLMEHDSSPEPQRNSSFHVVKKTKPKRKKRKKKEKESEKEKKEKKEKREKKKKKKEKKKKKKEKSMQQQSVDEMKPEDCTIRYDNEPTYIQKKLSKIRSKKVEKDSTNPFDDSQSQSQSQSQEDNMNKTNPFQKTISTNPFASVDNSNNNPFNDDNNVSMPTQKTKSTNPFADDLP